jgi:hypothetical protein
MQHQMKHEEKLAKRFLEKQGFSKIDYEPKGNRTPDFLLNDEIAVEVRRLNQHSTNETKRKPLEELFFKLIPKLVKLFNTYDNGKYTSSAFVSINFNRPLTADKNLINKIKGILDKHSLIMESTVEYEVIQNLTLEIFPSAERLEHQFNYIASSDNDAGGVVLSNILDSLKLIIKEKEAKITPFYAEYKIWWLILINFIGYGLKKSELTELKRLTDINKFDRIYFISPIDPTQGDYI